MVAQIVFTLIILLNMFFFNILCLDDGAGIQIYIEKLRVVIIIFRIFSLKKRFKKIVFLVNVFIKYRTKINFLKL